MDCNTENASEDSKEEASLPISFWPGHFDFLWPKNPLYLRFMFAVECGVVGFATLDTACCCLLLPSSASMADGNFHFADVDSWNQLFESYVFLLDGYRHLIESSSLNLNGLLTLQ